MQRKNLTVVSRALTTRIRIERGQATGVDFVRDGRKVGATAEREVILAGGAYNSPQLLMLSGIGPADALRSHGIKPLVDLPAVGQNLAEHPLVPLVVETREATSFVRHLRMDRAALRALQWFVTGGGPFIVNGNAAGLFARTRPELERPDVQLIFAALARDSSLWWPGQAHKQTFALQCSISIQHPEALGHLTLRSSDPADPPRILLNLFGAQSDIDTAIRGIRMARDIYARAPLRDLIKREVLPGPAATERGGINRARAAHRRDHPASVRHLPHGHRRGVGGGWRAARARGRRPACGRRVGHADNSGRSYQRADHHDRREGRRHDPRPDVGVRRVMNSNLS